MTKYVFTFDPKDERKFKEVLSRLDDDEYTVLEESNPVNKEDPRYSDVQTTVEMDAEAALTFRLGMKWLKIRRERTEEELATEAEREAKNTVKVTVKVDGYVPPAV